MSDHDERPDDRDDERLRDIYRAGAGEEPGADLDRRILAAAAAANRRRERQRRLPWAAGGLASAAVLVLAVTLVLGRGDAGDLEVKMESDPAAATPRPSGPSADAGRERAGNAATVPAPPPVRALAPQTSFRAAQDSTARDLVVEDTRQSAELQRLLELRASSRGAAFADAECPPAEIAPGATLRLVDDGLEVRADGELFVLVCVDGAWVRREPAPDITD